MQTIIQYNTFTKMQPINKGWSEDKKYYIETKSGEKLLLRLSPAASYERKRMQYKILSQLTNLGLNIPRPLDFGYCNEGSEVFTILTWVEGQDAGSSLPLLPEERQFALGYEAGHLLSQIHRIPAPETAEPWGPRFNRKLDKNLENYNNCGIKLSNEEIILAFVSGNRHLLHNRPQTFQHGDFHTGNMVITPEQRVGVIDFNRSDFGDPWEEFNRIVFSISVSPAFAAGKIKGYFQDSPPKEFFRLMALYIATNSLA